MKKEIKIAVIGLIIIAIVATSTALWAITKKATMSKKLNAVSKKLADLEGENTVLLEKLQLSKKQADSLKTRFDALRVDLKQSREEKEGLQARFTELEESKKKLLEKLRQLASEKQALERGESIATQPVESGDNEEEVQAIMQQLNIGEGGPDSEFVARILRQRAELEVDVKRLRSELAAVKQSAMDSKAKADLLKQDIDRLSESKQSFEEKASRSGEIADKLSRDYVLEREQRMAQAEELDSLKREYTNNKKELEDMRVDFEKANRERIALSRELDAMTSVLDDKQRELVRAKSLIDQLTGRTSVPAYSSVYSGASSDLPPPSSSAASSVELPPIVVRSGAAPIASKPAYSGSIPPPTLPPPLPGVSSSRVVSSPMPATVRSGPSVSGFGVGGTEGRILTVNEEHGFVVINFGKEQGVTVGMPFLVFRNGKQIGEIETIEVRQAISAADVVKLGSGIRELQQNDTVKRK